MSSAREEIAKRIAIIRGLSQWDALPAKQTKICGANCQEACLRDADAILSLKYPNGNPMLYVGAENQSIPENPIIPEDGYMLPWQVAEDMREIIKRDFREVKP